MPIDTLNADHIGQAGGGFEPQRTNNGLLYIAGLDGNENDLLTLSIASFPIPKSNIGIVEKRFQNQIRKFAGTPTYDDLSVVFNDYTDQNTATILARWHYLVHDPLSGKTGFASQYKKNGRVVLYAPDGSIEREYEVQGMWPSGFDPGDVDHEGEDTVRITMTLTIDRAIFKPAAA